MTQGHVPLRGRMLDLLVDAGTWVSRDELNTLSTCEPAVDDAIADLMVEGLAIYRENVGYRLAATEASRRAAQLQRRTGRRVAAVGLQGPNNYVVGVAKTVPDLGLVLYELQVPNPEPGADALAHLQRVVHGVIDSIGAEGGQHA